MEVECVVNVRDYNTGVDLASPKSHADVEGVLGLSFVNLVEYGVQELLPHIIRDWSVVHD